jgi:hypothetical protein
MRELSGGRHVRAIDRGVGAVATFGQAGVTRRDATELSSRFKAAGADRDECGWMRRARDAHAEAGAALAQVERRARRLRGQVAKNGRIVARAWDAGAGGVL